MVMVNQIIHLGVGIENSQTLVCTCKPSMSSIHSTLGGRMEDPFQQERKETEYKDLNEEQGWI